MRGSTWPPEASYPDTVFTVLHNAFHVGNSAWVCRCWNSSFFLWRELTGRRCLSFEGGRNLLEIANSCSKSTLVNKVGDRILENKSVNKQGWLLYMSSKMAWDAF